MNGFMIIDGRRFDVVDGVLCARVCGECGGDAPLSQFVIYRADGPKPLCADCQRRFQAAAWQRVTP